MNPLQVTACYPGGEPTQRWKSGLLSMFAKNCDIQLVIKGICLNLLTMLNWSWTPSPGNDLVAQEELTKSQAHPGKAAKEEVAPSHLSTDLKQAENWEHGGPVTLRVLLFLFPAATVILKHLSFIASSWFGILRCWPATYEPAQRICISRHLRWSMWSLTRSGATWDDSNRHLLVGSGNETWSS